jgi:hypothetical protein
MSGRQRYALMEVVVLLYPLQQKSEEGKDPNPIEREIRKA